MKLADLAAQIYAEHDITFDESLTIATTYAVDLGYHAPDGGTDPDLVVTDHDADLIIDVVRAAKSTNTSQ